MTGWVNVIDQDVRQAIRLARQGDKVHAQELLKQVLRRDPSNADAWVVLAQLVESRSEAISYMRRAANLRPEDERAKRYLHTLLQQELPPRPQPTVPTPGPSKTTIMALAAAAIVMSLGLVVVVYIFMQPGSQPAQQGTATPLGCEAFVAQALELSEQSCRSIDRNQVCYGHSTITAQLKPGTTARFDTIGDKIELDVMDQFFAFSLNPERQEWGIGVFKLAANVRGSLPEQTVTLFSFGSSVDNVSGDMQTFTFSSGPGSTSCENVPFEGILIRMPDGAGLRFTANGAEITLMGTGVLQAQQGQQMSVSLLSGIARIVSRGQEQTFSAGQEVTVPLKGLEADGPPSEPVTMAGDVAKMACVLASIGCPGTKMPVISQANLEATLAAVSEQTSEPTTVAEITDDPPTRTAPPPTSSPTSSGPTDTPTSTVTPGGPTVTPETPTTPPPTTPPPTTPPPTTPPSTTPPPIDCSKVSTSWGGHTEDKMTITVNITNSTGGVVEITGVGMASSVSNTLQSIKLGNSPIWSPGAGEELSVPEPPNYLTVGPNQGTPMISSGVTGVNITFVSGIDASYSIRIVVNETCIYVTDGAVPTPPN